MLLGWAIFAAVVAAMLALDLGVLQKRAHEPSTREALLWTGVWISLGLAFGAFLWVWMGPDDALAYLTGYVVEKALSVDNVFVFVVIFGALAIPRALHHRVLFWGVFGAIVLRGTFIFAGLALIERFHFLLYGFGILLVVLGAKLLFGRKETEEGPPVGLRLAQRFLPVGPLDGSAFTTLREGRRVATPMLVALVAAEGTDVVFAVDSIPAVFAITNDPFLVTTSNIFALLGMRSLYALLAGAVVRLRYLPPALALVLLFIGAKLLAAPWWKLPIGASLGVVAALLGGGIVASLLPWSALTGSKPDATSTRPLQRSGKCPSTMSPSSGPDRAAT
ncbi:MAG: TerC/Alx family metal homeostasis membrane protein [Myxococcales bacterium]